jgi:SulP family sulfate permease
MQDSGQASFRRDFTGGLVSSCVAIPLAMGFGMFAFVSLGDEYFVGGALAGLVTALIVGTASVVLGDKTPNVYAPRIASTFFLGILLHNLLRSDLPIMASGGLPLTLAIIFSIILLGALFQLLFGLIRLGTLIKFTPHPVMAGFQNAAAILLFLVQLGNTFGFDRNMPFVQALGHVSEAKPLSVAIAAIVFVMMWNAKAILPRVPPLIVGLLVGTGCYYALVLAGFGHALGPIIGSASLTALVPPTFPHFEELVHHAHIGSILPTIVGGALALAIIASIDALLCAKLLTRPGEPKVDGNRLLMRLGIGNTLAACFGGITSGLNLGPSLANRAFGGHTPVSVLVNAFVILVTLAALFPIVAYLPRVALSAAIMVVAVQHIDPWTVRMIRRIASGAADYRRNILLDLFVVLLVATLSVVLDIVLAVFLGVAIAAALFMVRMSRSIIRRLYRCKDIRSRKSRTAQEIAILEQTGATVLVMELQGALFFGTAEKVANEIAAQMLQDTRHVILDLRRITEIDSTGAQILHEIGADLAAHGKHLLISVAQPSESAELLADAGVIDAMTPARIFRDLDRAIESAEDELLRSDPREDGAEKEIPLDRISILTDFTSEDLAAIEKHLGRVVYEPGRVIFREGETGKELYIIAKGAASAYLHQANGGDIRLASFAPGTVFGEIAILDGGPRSATVVTNGELVCYVLPDKEFKLLSAQDPAVAIKLLTNLGRELSRRVRQANRTIHQLEQ